MLESPPDRRFLGWHALPGTIGLVFAIAGAGGAFASWCDLVFRDVVARAPVVALAEVRSVDRSGPRLEVTGVLRGSEPDGLGVSPEELKRLDLKRGDRLLMALTEGGVPLRAVPGMGDCRAVGLVPLRGGRLRSRERAAYDGKSGALPLERVLEDLRSALPPD